MSVLAVLVLASAAVVTAGPAQAAATCTEAEVIAVRGTDEATPIGRMLTPAVTAIVDGARAKRISVTVYGLPYSAAMASLESPGEGTAMLAQHVNARAKECPKMTFAILGYSQGAIVIGDALAGTGFGFTAPPIPTSLAPRIKAVVLYGNGYFRAGKSYDHGSSVTDNPGVSGIAPRNDSAMAAYTKALADYCNAGDPACQSSPKGSDGHVDYARYGSDAGAFVIAALKNQAAPAPSQPSPPAPTAPSGSDWLSQLLGSFCGFIGC